MSISKLVRKLRKLDKTPFETSYDARKAYGDLVAEAIAALETVQEKANAVQESLIVLRCVLK